MMSSDPSIAALFREISGFCDEVRRPGSEQISDVANLVVSPDGRYAAYSAFVACKSEQNIPTRLALTSLEDGDSRIITDGPNSDRLPKFSPDGRSIAFLSNRGAADRFQLHLFDMATGTVTPGPEIDGSAEQLHWSPDGSRILLVGFDAQAEERARAGQPFWAPIIDDGRASVPTRRCWICDPVAGTARKVGPDDLTVWAATWRTESDIVLLASKNSGEDGWYDAQLENLDLSNNGQYTLLIPLGQIGPAVASPSSDRIAIVEGLCSDRGPVIGDLLIIDPALRMTRRAETGDVNILNMAWQSERHLLLSGFRGLESVIGIYDLDTTEFREIWASAECSISGDCLAAMTDADDCLFVTEGFAQAPQIMRAQSGGCHVVRSFDIGYSSAMASLADARPLAWASADGTEIEGWFLQPGGEGPFPLIVDIHGGPVGHWRSAFLARKMLHVPALLRRGFAIFLPNPRGSSGRGQAFTRQVMGDLGGGDAADILSGIDMLAAQGLIDHDRIGITGVSYGGFMSAWLVTQSDRFKAAVSVSAHTNQLTATFLSNIPGFMSRLVDDVIAKPGNRYYSRSPALQVHEPIAPVLNICGGLDRCTPPEEAVLFHKALRTVDSESVLITYPHEGHGVRGLPAAIDCAARLTNWFKTYILAD